MQAEIKFVFDKATEKRIEALVTKCIREELEAYSLGRMKPTTREPSPEMAKKRLAEFAFSVRTYNVLCAYGIHTIGELLQYTKQEVLKFRNTGMKVVYDIEKVLSDNGIEWK